MVKALAYSQAIFILKDKPGISIMGAITESQVMMRGHKWENLWLNLSFLGWFILSVCSLGLGLIFTLPYLYTTNVAYYDDLRLEQSGEGLIYFNLAKVLIYSNKKRTPQDCLRSSFFIGYRFWFIGVSLNCSLNSSSLKDSMYCVVSFVISTTGVNSLCVNVFALSLNGHTL